MWDNGNKLGKFKGIHNPVKDSERPLLALFLGEEVHMLYKQYASWKPENPMCKMFGHYANKKDRAEFTPIPVGIVWPTRCFSSRGSRSSSVTIRHS